MINNFLEGLGDKLGENWVTSILTPAFIFWAGGLLAWVLAQDQNQVKDKAEQFASWPSYLQWALLIAGLIIIGISSLIVQSFDFTILRVLEGYWPKWANPLKRVMVKYRDKQLERIDARFQELSSKDKLSAEEQEEFSILDSKLFHMPAKEYLAPTQLGNILRAAEMRPLNKYGLNVAVCWPRLWLLLSEEVKAELVDARAALDAAARIWLWGLLFLVWSIWTWWFALIGLLAILLAYRRMLSSAQIYGTLLEGTFDLYRSLIYQSLRWPLPNNTIEERQTGEVLTAYLWRGSDQVPRPLSPIATKPTD